MGAGGAFCWDTGFNSMARTPDDDASRLLGWLLGTWRRLWPTLSEAEMVELLCRPWRLTEVTCEKLGSPPHDYVLWEGLEQAPLCKAIKTCW